MIWVAWSTPPVPTAPCGFRKDLLAYQNEPETTFVGDKEWPNCLLPCVDCVRVPFSTVTAIDVDSANPVVPEIVPPIDVGAPPIAVPATPDISVLGQLRIETCGNFCGQDLSILLRLV